MNRTKTSIFKGRVRGGMARFRLKRTKGSSLKCSGGLHRTKQKLPSPSHHIIRLILFNLNSHEAFVKLHPVAWAAGHPVAGRLWPLRQQLAQASAVQARGHRGEELLAPRRASAAPGGVPRVRA